VLVVGAHAPRKNHVAVLEAAERLWRKGHRFQLVFMGGSKWRAEGYFDAYVDRLQHDGRPVRVERRVSESVLWDAYRRARFTVFPSLIEGFGLPVAESLAAGTPVVTSNYGSMAEIAAGGGALTVDPRDVDDLEGQMRRLLEDDELVDRLGAEARGRDMGSWSDYSNAVWSFFFAGSARAS
jgi:glycosyltransferase involved in cell wall biosynthesis